LKHRGTESTEERKEERGEKRGEERKEERKEERGGVVVGRLRTEGCGTVG
jgi:hypothetical protein